MASATVKSGTGIPEWTSKEEKRGLDPLAMQTSSIALYQELVPGISNVTLRMRYYGFYAWLANAYAKQVGDTSGDIWCRFVRRAEALYALVAAKDGSERGIAGILWANKKLDGITGNRVMFHGNADRGDEPQYLKQKFGAFGAAYGSQLVEIGILEYVENHDVPVPTATVGDKLARSFQKAIGDVARVFLSALDRGSVSRSDLERMAVMLPSRLGKDTAERQIYEDLLFARIHPGWETAIAREQTLRLILRVAEANAADIDANYVRWTLYANRNDQGEALGQLNENESAQRFVWAVYQANDLLTS